LTDFLRPSLGVLDLGLKFFESVTVPQSALGTNWQCVGFAIDSQEFDKVRVHFRKVALSAQTPDRARSFDIRKLASEKLTGKLDDFLPSGVNFVVVHAGRALFALFLFRQRNSAIFVFNCKFRLVVGDSFRFWH
jgi:hypothetical protein